MPDKRLSRLGSLSQGLTWAIAVIAAGALSAIVLLAMWAVVRIDERALDRQTRAATTGLVELRARLPKEQDSSAIWDDAVTAVRERDHPWMEENLTAWMSSFHGHDVVVVLDPANRPIAAAAEGEPTDPQAHSGDLAAVGRLISGLRAEMAGAARGAEDPTGAITGLGAEALVRLADGSIAIASVRPIVPSAGLVAQAAGEEYLHLSILRLESEVLGGIGTQYGLSELAVEPAEPAHEAYAAIPLLDAGGETLGFLTWKRDRPAFELIAQTAPAVGLGGGLTLTLLALLLARLRQAGARLRRSQAQTQYLAFHDSLTGIPNRALFEDRLEHALVEARRSKGRIALHYIDLDRFKHVNDTLGHPAGDELIRQVANRLVAALPPTDTVARLGGDEFAIIQADARDDRDGLALSERLLGEIARPYCLLGDAAEIGASIGVVLSGEADCSREEMMRKADIALYEAKGSGRGSVRLFAGDLDEQVRFRRGLERDLREALQTGTGLHLAYQPLFDAADNRVIGAEALARWNHPVLGRLAPDLFISIAEDRGLIEALGLWVMREACRFALSSDVPWVAVNVSPLQFRADRFPDKVFGVLNETGLPPDRLQLEITEGLLLENSAHVQETLRGLRAGGVKVALDDFGTGYSSINYLRTYGVDKLKIDQSFVAQLGRDTDVDAIVRAIIELARAMHMQVSAEGVETPGQQALLRAMGCNELQGYLLARPMSAADMRALFEGLRATDENRSVA